MVQSGTDTAPKQEPPAERNVRWWRIHGFFLRQWLAQPAHDLVGEDHGRHGVLVVAEAHSMLGEFSRHRLATVQEIVSPAFEYEFPATGMILHDAYADHRK